MPLQKRYSNRYYTRIAIPHDLREIIERNEYIRALRTTSAQEARARGYKIEAHVYDVFAELRRQKGRMTTDQLKALAQRYLFDKLDAAESMAAQVLAEAPENPDALEVRKDQLADALEDDGRRFGTKLQQRQLRELADSLMAGAGLDIPRDSVGYNLFVLLLAQAQQRAAKAELSLLNGDYEALTAVRGQPLPAPAPHSKRLSEVVSEYLAKRRATGRWSPKTDKSVTGILSVVVELIGDRPIDTITKADMRAFQATLDRIPAHAAKRYAKLSLREAIERADAEGNQERLSAGSKNDYMTWTRTLWKWALKNDLATVNAAAVLEDHEEAHERDQRGRFTPEQIAALLRVLEPERETFPAHWWVPRLMLSSGMRLEEVAKLRPCDIQQDCGIWLMDVNGEAGRLKTRDSKRRVPVHSSLVADLLQRKEKVERESGPQANLWGLAGPDSRGRWSEQLSKRLNKRIDQAGMTDKKLVMESARNTFINTLRQAGVDEPTVADLVGHRSGGTMSFSRYSDRAGLQRLAEAVELFKVPLTVAAVPGDES